MQVRAVLRGRGDLLRSTQEADPSAAARTPLTRSFALQITAGSRTGSQAAKRDEHAPRRLPTTEAADLPSQQAPPISSPDCDRSIFQASCAAARVGTSGGTATRSS